MGSSLSFHFIPNHRYERYYQAFSDVMPTVSLILDASKDDYLNVKNRVGDGRIILRSYEWSDGGMSVLQRAQHDPEGTGRWMAQNWIARAAQWGVIDRERTYFTGVNEYTVVPGVPIEPFVRCEYVFAEELGKAGYRACVGNEGVGHPAHLNPDGSVNWNPYVSWESILKKTNSILGLHEYWRGEYGPRMNVKPEDEAKNRYWYAWRFFQCPFDVPIAITEWGIDQKVDAPMGTPSKGWLGTVDADTYVRQLEEYLHKAVTDKRFVGATIFTHDYASDEWASYDTDRALPQITALGQRAPRTTWYVPGSVPTPIPPEPEPVPPTTSKVVCPLPLGSYRISQPFYMNPEDYADMGLRGHDGTDLAAVAGTPVMAIADGVVAWVDDDRNNPDKPFRGGYGLYIRVWHPELRCHSHYSHLKMQGVTAGQQVKAGQKIGEVGLTGNTTGYHLHLEIRIAKDDEGTYSNVTPMGKGRVDPESFLALYGLSLFTGHSEVSSKVFLPLILA